MAIELEILSATDKPALLVLTTPEYLAIARAVLSELGYKVHAVASHDEFTARYAQVPYQVVVVEETFASGTQDENQALKALQLMPMGQRRHTTFILLADNYQTMHPMQAYRQSVHVIVNRNDIGSLKQIAQKTISDNELFYNIFKDTQARLAAGK